MDPFILLFIIILFIGIVAYIFEYKILPGLPAAEPFNWILRAIFWLAIIVVIWKYVFPLVKAAVL